MIRPTALARCPTKQIRCSTRCEGSLRELWWENRSITKTTQHIGRAGELLVQYRLLLLGIDSAPMTTDSGIDLVAYSSHTAKPTTIQVKANRGPKPGGGKGKAALDWWVPEDSPAQLIALVDLSEERVWLLTMEDLALYAQQQSGGRFHIYMYTDPTVAVRGEKKALVGEFEGLLLEHRAVALLGAPPKETG